MFAPERRRQIVDYLAIAVVSVVDYSNQRVRLLANNVCMNRKIQAIPGQRQIQEINRATVRKAEIGNIVDRVQCSARSKC